MTGTWKYLLSDHNGVEQKCLVTDMAGLVDNMTDNMHYATLNELKEDGILDIDDSTLQSDIVYEIKVGSVSVGIMNDDQKFKNEDSSVKVDIGELTIEETLDYVTHVITAINKVNNGDVS